MNKNKFTRHEERLKQDEVRRNKEVKRKRTKRLTKNSVNYSFHLHFLFKIKIILNLLLKKTENNKDNNNSTQSNVPFFEQLYDWPDDNLLISNEILICQHFIHKQR